MHHHLRFNVATQYDFKFFLKNWKGRSHGSIGNYCPETIVTSTTKLSVQCNLDYLDLVYPERRLWVWLQIER